LEKSRGETDSKFVFLAMRSTPKMMTFHLPVVHSFGIVFCWWQLNKTENGGGKGTIFKMNDDFLPHKKKYH